MAVSKYDIELDLAQNPGSSHAHMVHLVGSNKRVLDVGCSTGYLSKALAALGNTVSGIEYSAEDAEEARPYLDKLVVADLEKLDIVAEFGEASFDVVVFGDVLEHLRDPLTVLRQARPLLKPGGCIVVSVPNIAHGDVRLALLKGSFNYTRLGLLDETHTRFFTRQSLETFLHDGGFAPVEVRRTKAELFTTEVGVRREDFDPALIEEIRRDFEGTTYQFVVRAVRDDADHIDAELVGRVEAQERRLRDLELEIRDLAAERDKLLAEQGDRDVALEEELAEQRKLALHYRAEVDALHRTKTMRMARLPRTVWSTMARGRRRGRDAS